ncbi:MAG: dihydrodipicolinate synthase family protein [Spirochaetaceae bacterium]|nr:dihydrodipicolinate synthase family protein [Spirochaetaceae bacterium]
MGIFSLSDGLSSALKRGMAIPAIPLALGASRKFDKLRQRALVRYYLDSGAGGIAAGVHTTQFAIRDPEHGLFEPVLSAVSETIDEWSARRGKAVMKIGGVCGPTAQAKKEAAFLVAAGYHAGLLSLAGHARDTNEELLGHVREVAALIPVVGFYLQPAVGGRVLPYGFWRALADIQNVIAIKIAPFNRYQSFDVVRAVAESGRDDIALYTGNDDNIVVDLLTEYAIRTPLGVKRLRIAGGLLGHWSVWTGRAVELLAEARELSLSGASVPQSMLTLAAEVTDANAAVFDAAHAFAGCIPGIHEVLRRQGLLEGTWCLDPKEVLSPGQAEEIDRVCRAYPHLTDDEFVQRNLGTWLS